MAPTENFHDRTQSLLWDMFHFMDEMDISEADEEEKYNELDEAYKLINQADSLLSKIK